jgi:hypothetical protein
MDIHEIPADKLKEFASIMGKKGGLSTKTNQPQGYFKRISLLGVEARRAKKDRKQGA